MIPWLDVSRLSIATAAGTIEAALRAGLDPEAGPPRVSVEVPGGELLLMPASGNMYAGVKVVSIAPDNPARGLPRIQGTYLLFHGESLAPLAICDGADLTSVRTPAVSAVAIKQLTPDAPLRTVVYGTGPQAWGHVRATAAFRRIQRLAVFGRDRARTEAFASRCRAIGVPAATGDDDAVRDADLILCCTTATRPLFDGRWPPERATVVAIGSHRPGMREVDDLYVRRAVLTVEARTAATREAGELIGIDPTRLTNLAELLRRRPEPGRPRLFKSVGMAWEDLVVAAAAYEHGTAQ